MSFFFYEFCFFFFFFSSRASEQQLMLLTPTHVRIMAIESRLETDVSIVAKDMAPILQKVKKKKNVFASLSFILFFFLYKTFFLDTKRHFENHKELRLVI